MFKRISAGLLCFFFIFFLVSCSPGGDNQSNQTVQTMTGKTEYPVTIKDEEEDVTIKKQPSRIVSLAPADTEIIFSLGAQDRLVGRTDYCNYPKEASEIPSIGSYSNPNVELILAQNPDLIISGSFLSESIKTQLESSGAVVLTLVPVSINEVEESIVKIAEAVNCNDAAAGMVENMQKEADNIKASLENVTEEKTVFIDLGDFYSVGPGSLLNSELEEIKAINIAEATDQAYPQLSAETIVSEDPDVYISFTSSPQVLLETPGFDTIKAFKDDDVIYYPPNSNEANVINRPGPRVVEGMKVLAKDIYPDAFK